MKRSCSRYLALLLSIAMIFESQTMTVSATNSNMLEMVQTVEEGNEGVPESVEEGNEGVPESVEEVNEGAPECEDEVNEDVQEHDGEIMDDDNSDEYSLSDPLVSEGAPDVGKEDPEVDFELSNEEKTENISNSDIKARIDLNCIEFSMDAGFPSRVIAAPYPEDMEYTWESDDESIATVDEDGMVYGWSEGSCRIYVKAKDGSASSFCTVHVAHNMHKVSSIEEFQSPHDYENNCQDVWEYSDPNRDKVVIKFSEETEMADKDLIYVTDGNNKEYGAFTGEELAGKGILINSGTVRVRIKSNKSGTAYGFRVVSVEGLREEGFRIHETTLLEYQGTEEDVVIPDGITKIFDRAFKDNKTIKSVKIPRSVKSIGASAFSGCSALEYVDLGRVEEYGEKAFENCTSLTSVVIPKTLTGGPWAGMFPGCSSLRKVEFEAGSKTITAVCRDTPVEEVIIPEGVTSIMDYAFSGCKGITEIKLPETLESIGACAFRGCGTFEELILPANLKTIGRYAFSCEGITNFYYTKDLAALISQRIFESLEFTTRIENLYVEEGVEKVQTVLVANTKLENIYITDASTRIESVYAFESGYYRIYNLPEGTVIHGIVGSGVQKYAKEHDHKFISIGEYLKPISELKIEEISAVEYTGGGIQPRPVVKDGESVLEEGKHYTLSYSANVGVGTGYVTVTGISESGYKGSKEISFVISPFDISKNDGNRFLINYEKTVEFNKQGARPKVSVSFKNSDGTRKMLKEGTDYTVSYKSNKKYNSKEKPTIVITAQGDYTGRKDVQFSLKERNISNANMVAVDRPWISVPNCYATIVAVTDSNTILLPGTDIDNLRYVYSAKTVVKVSGKKVTRKAGETIGVNDVIPVNTVIKVIATAKKGSGYTGTISATYKLYSVAAIIRSILDWLGL